MKLASSFNSRTSKATLYENLRKIKGTPKRKTNILQDENYYHTTHNDIANKFGKTFSETSITTNDKQNFKFKFKTRLKENSCKVSYNKLFTLEEQESALRRTRDTAPAPDEVYYKMAKEMRQVAKKHLVTTLNKFWREEYFSEKWREATVIVFP